jgi:hypothetical protein
MTKRYTVTFEIDSDYEWQTTHGTRGSFKVLEAILVPAEAEISSIEIFDFPVGSKATSSTADADKFVQSYYIKNEAEVWYKLDYNVSSAVDADFTDYEDGWTVTGPDGKVLWPKNESY